MNFTNSPHERMMKEIPHKEAPAPQKAPEGTPCAGCTYWRGSAVFSVIESTSKSSADVWTFGPKKCPVCKGFQPRFLRG